MQGACEASRVIGLIRPGTDTFAMIVIVACNAGRARESESVHSGAAWFGGGDAALRGPGTDVIGIEVAPMVLGGP